MLAIDLFHYNIKCVNVIWVATTGWHNLKICYFHFQNQISKLNLTNERLENTTGFLIVFVEWSRIRVVIG